MKLFIKWQWGIGNGIMIKINLLKPKFNGRFLRTFWVYDTNKFNTYKFKPTNIKLKVLIGPPWYEDPIENRMTNGMVDNSSHNMNIK